MFRIRRQAAGHLLGGPWRIWTKARRSRKRKKDLSLGSPENFETWDGTVAFAAPLTGFYIMGKRRARAATFEKLDPPSVARLKAVR